MPLRRFYHTPRHMSRHVSLIDAFFAAYAIAAAAFFDDARPPRRFYCFAAASAILYADMAPFALMPFSLPMVRARYGLHTAYAACRHAALLLSFRRRHATLIRFR